MTSLIVALDTPDHTIQLYRTLSKTGSAFKIGVPLLLEPRGWALAREIVRDGNRLMLDLKLYDTRDTVLRTMEAVERLGAHWVTVHEDCIEHFGAFFAVLAVRGLTDGTGNTNRFAAFGLADGVVCSVLRAAAIRSYTDKLLVCPGIRPEGWGNDNHMLAATPQQAREAGADYIVVGRPIYQADNPVAAARAIMDALAEPQQSEAAE